MKINHNKNQKNKKIYANLIIQLRNYSGTNLEAQPSMECKLK